MNSSRNLLIALVLALVCVNRAGGTNRLKAIALAEPPDATSGFIDFDTIQLNNASEVAFIGDLASFPSNNHGVWHYGAEFGLVPVARVGDQAPGAHQNDRFGEMLSTMYLNDNGHVAFRALLTSPTSVEGQGVWSTASGNGLELVLKTGDPVAGAPSGLTSWRIALSDFNNTGHTLLYADFISDNPDFTSGRGIISEADGNGPELIALRDFAAPGITTPDATMVTLSNEGLNDQGLVIFRGVIKAPSLSTSSSQVNPNAVAWQKKPGEEAMPIGHTSPVDSDLPSSREFTNINYFSSNNQGQVFHAIGSRYSGPIGLQNTDGGLWELGEDGSVRTIARTASPASGLEPGHVYSVMSRPQVNDRGTVLMGARFIGPRTESHANGLVGIWVEKVPGADLELVVAEGFGELPGTDVGGVTVNQIFDVQLNERDQIAIFADFGFGSGANTGIFIREPTGEFTKVAQTGDVLDVSDDPQVPDFREIQYLSGFEGGFPQTRDRFEFNDLGEVAFLATFTDGTRGLLLRTVPEPSALLLAILGLGMYANGRSQRSA